MPAYAAGYGHSIEGLGKRRENMRVGDTIHLDGLRAEYSHYGRDRFTPCTLPNGEYVIVGFDDAYVKLAWKNATGAASTKHRYRVQKTSVV